MADLNHLHLHVADLDASRAFYGRYFGLLPSRRFGSVHFLRGEEGFDLALEQDDERTPWPSWFHLGFRLEASEHVRALHARMQADGSAPPGDLHDEPDFVFFRVRDPDGLAIDVYWE